MLSKRQRWRVGCELCLLALLVVAFAIAYVARSNWNLQVRLNLAWSGYPFATVVPKAAAFDPERQDLEGRIYVPYAVYSYGHYVGFVDREGGFRPLGAEDKLSLLSTLGWFWQMWLSAFGIMIMLGVLLLEADRAHQKTLNGRQLLSRL